MHHFVDDSRGQVFTLAAVIAALILMAGLLYAMSITPASGERETIDDLNKEQDHDLVADFLNVGMETGKISEAVLYWDRSEGDWVSAPSSGYYARTPSAHPLHAPLERLFVDEGVAFNIAVEYQTPSGDTDLQRMVYQGTPGPGAVYATSTIVLYDDDNLHGPDDSHTLENTPSYFAEDANPNSNRYNTIRVRIIAWRT